MSLCRTLDMVIEEVRNEERNEGEMEREKQTERSNDRTKGGNTKKNKHSLQAGFGSTRAEHTEHQRAQPLTIRPNLRNF